jgi:hypothetical protein
MAFDLESVLEDTEDFLRRHIRSRTARDAQKRRARRKLEEFGRRARRAGFILVGLLAALIALSLFAVEIGFFTWLVVLPTIFLFACLTLTWPTRRQAEAVGPAAPQTLPLDELAARAEEGLLERSRELPGRALPAADAIIARLNELRPNLGALEADSMLAGDARRLIGRHLPQLIDSYLELPPSSRGPGAETSRRLIESLDIVAGELDTLLDQCCRDRKLGFDTQSRFIETRYRDDGTLRGE